MLEQLMGRSIILSFHILSLFCSLVFAPNLVAKDNSRNQAEHFPDVWINNNGTSHWIPINSNGSFHWIPSNNGSQLRLKREKTTAENHAKIWNSAEDKSVKCESGEALDSSMTCRRIEACSRYCYKSTSGQCSSDQRVPSTNYVYVSGFISSDGTELSRKEYSCCATSSVRLRRCRWITKIDQVEKSNENSGDDPLPANAEAGGAVAIIRNMEETRYEECFAEVIPGFKHPASCSQAKPSHCGAQTGFAGKTGSGQTIRVAVAYASASEIAAKSNSGCEAAISDMQRTSSSKSTSKLNSKSAEKLPTLTTSTMVTGFHTTTTAVTESTTAITTVAETTSTSGISTTEPLSTSTVISTLTSTFTSSSPSTTTSTLSTITSSTSTTISESITAASTLTVTTAITTTPTPPAVTTTSTTTVTSTTQSSTVTSSTSLAPSSSTSTVSPSTTSTVFTSTITTTAACLVYNSPCTTDTGLRCCGYGPWTGACNNGMCAASEGGEPCSKNTDCLSESCNGGFCDAGVATTPCRPENAPFDCISSTCNSAPGYPLGGQCA